MSQTKRTRLSSTHERADLRAQNSLYEKVGRATTGFEKERCEYNARQLADAGKSEAKRRREAEARVLRRSSFMVKRQKPNPVLRPSQQLALGPDRAAFNKDWSDEQRSARRAQVRELKSARRDLRQADRDLEKADADRKDAASLAARGDFNAARRETFKSERRVRQIDNYVRKRTEQSR